MLTWSQAAVSADTVKPEGLWTVGVCWVVEGFSRVKWTRSCHLEDVPPLLRKASSVLCEIRIEGGTSSRTPEPVQSWSVRRRMSWATENFRTILAGFCESLKGGWSVNQLTRLLGGGLTVWAGRCFPGQCVTFFCVSKIHTLWISCWICVRLGSVLICRSGSDLLYCGVSGWSLQDILTDQSVGWDFFHLVFIKVVWRAKFIVFQSV